ncbi:hypothetical protein [Paenibacillus flagellatus]|uniref:hypothetical protein n=1 Tax=Paenibacillus flagellatus TaxID=2211139 RepID=UPI0013053335|nr:hypothetical protein [Paenibacillus flagellatus]
MNDGKETVKRRLDEELADVVFAGRDEVLRRAFPRTAFDRLLVIWNKDIEIPVVPGAALVAVLVLALAVYTGDGSNPDGAALRSRQLVEAGGSTYWKDELERAVADAENQNQS